VYANVLLGRGIPPHSRGVEGYLKMKKGRVKEGVETFRKEKQTRRGGMFHQYVEKEKISTLPLFTHRGVE